MFLSFHPEGVNLKPGLRRVVRPASTLFWWGGGGLILGFFCFIFPIVPWVLLLCCYPPVCVVSQQSWFGLLFFFKSSSSKFPSFYSSPPPLLNQSSTSVTNFLSKILPFSPPLTNQAKTSGVKVLIVFINKMDDPTVEWSQKRSGGSGSAERGGVGVPIWTASVRYCLVLFLISDHRRYDECVTKLTPFLKSAGFMKKGRGEKNTFYG